MRARVLGAVPAVPTQSVQLDLSVEEFALLKALVYHSLDGISASRGAIDVGLLHAYWQLHPHWRDKVDEACRLGKSSLLATKVSAVFA